MKVLANLLSESSNTEVDRNSQPMLQVFDSVDNLASFKFPTKNEGVLSIVCIEGSVNVTADMREISIPEKSMCVLLPGHLIEQYSTSDNFRGFLISSAKRNFASFLPVLSRLLMCSMYFQDRPVIRLSDKELLNQTLLYDLLKNKLEETGGTFDRMVVNKVLEAIFCETIANFFKRLDVNLTTYCNRSESLFYRFIVDVEKHYTKERSVSFYADNLCVSPKHLSSVVKDISSRTASDWIDSYVINEIKHLLASTDLTIQQISCKLNFANQSFFGKYFKTHTGMSPRQFRSSRYQ